MPDESPIEEDLETGGGYGKFVFVNHNDDDGDGIPDYADLDNSDEGNFVPVVLKIDIPDVPYSDVSVSFYFDGLARFFDTTYDVIKDPRGITAFTGFFDHRAARRTGDAASGWNYPTMRLWAIEDPSQYLYPENLVLPGNTYSAVDLGFGQGEDPSRIVLYVEGINQIGGGSASPRPATLQVRVSVSDRDYDDVVRLTVIEVDLGTNNSNKDPFVFDPENPSHLRPGIPDVEFLIDEFDEIVEDQRDGFVFWKRAEHFKARPIDMFPIAIEVPLPLKENGYEFLLRTDVEDADFTIVDNVSSPGNPIGFINEGLRFQATKIKLGMSGKPLAYWKLPRERVGKRTSYLLFPKFMESLDREHVVTIKLVGRDRKKNEVVVDSFKLTLKPLIWDGEPFNDFFWMGSARGEPGGSYNYPADFVAGNRVSQDIPIYPQFSWFSGPDPDDQKEHYLAYIHGFNINPDQAFRDSAEVYKRMWWAGYRGNFFALTWHGDEWDPLNHACDYLPEGYSIFCLARYYPNMENALQTSPRLRQFLVELVLGDWGAEPENVNLMVHSLGNLMTLDALRLHSIASGEKLINNMISVEAAVWQETLWDQGPTIINADLTYTEEDLMRGSWAFWFNQNENPVSDSFGHMYNSFTRNDEALVAMKINDYLPILGTLCTYPTLPGLPIAPCPRVERAQSRGAGEHYRVPVADGIRVRDASGAGEPDNRPDLSYEIPALLDSDPPGGFHLPWDDLLIPPWNALTNPLGMEEAPENSKTTIHNIDTMSLAWPEAEHSWFLEGDLWEIWPWYEFLTRPSGEDQKMIVPSGKE